jgi:hypothetical protein
MTGCIMEIVAGERTSAGSNNYPNKLGIRKRERDRGLPVTEGKREEEKGTDREHVVLQEGTGIVPARETEEVEREIEGAAVRDLRTTETEGTAAEVEVETEAEVEIGTETELLGEATLLISRQVEAAAGTLNEGESSPRKVRITSEEVG